MSTDSTTTATMTPSTVTTTPNTGNFGNILIVSSRGSNDVNLLDVEKKTNCQLTEFPTRPSYPAGGLIISDGRAQPLICGSGFSECHLLESGKWSKIYNLPDKRRSNFGVSIDSQWIMFNGGFTWTGPDNGTAYTILRSNFLVNKKGQKIELKPLTKARWVHCSAILSSNESSTEVGILGGMGTGPGALTSMERYRCVKGDTPTCEKLSDGPDMFKGTYRFGCGTLQTGQGGRVLLAIGNKIKNKPTQVLNLGNKESKWEILSADMDVPYKEEQSFSFSYSFVTSTTEPTVGYFLPSKKQYIYRVKCKDAQTCSFEKIDIGYEIPSGTSVAMAIPADALTCP